MSRREEKKSFGKNEKRAYSKAAGKNAAKLLGALLVFEVGFLFLILVAVIIVEASSLYYTEAFTAARPVLVILMYIVFFAGSLAGCGWIIYRFMLRPMKDMEDVAEAARELAHPTEHPVVLPGGLEEIQDDLNRVREQALESRQAAREAEKQKDDLLVYLAHDLRTPLTSIIGYLKLIEDEPELPRDLVIKYTGIAREKTERLEELINEFFEITRFTTNRLSLEFSSVNLSRMLRQIAFEFNPILKEKELEWDLHIPEGIEITCDPDKMERAVDNLIRNAVNYSYRQSRISFSLEKAGESVKICMENRGQTIPQEKLERIFEQFYRLDGARSSDSGGAGLGLAIAREIVRAHGGTILAYSADEKIRFEIGLPLRHVEIEQHPA